MEPQTPPTQLNPHQPPDAEVGIPTDPPAGEECRDISTQNSHPSKTPMIIAGVIIALLIATTGVLAYQNMSLSSHIKNLESAVQEMEEVGDPDRIIDGTGMGVVTAPSTSDMASIPDMPLDEKIEGILAVKYVVEHRTALNGRDVTVSGIMVANHLAIEKPCTSQRCPLMTTPPQITIATTADETRNTAYDLTVLLSPETQEEYAGYQIGTEVTITGTVEGGTYSVMVRPPEIWGI